MYRASATQSHKILATHFGLAVIRTGGFVALRRFGLATLQTACRLAVVHCADILMILRAAASGVSGATTIVGSFKISICDFRTTV